MIKKNNRRMTSEFLIPDNSASKLMTHIYTNYLLMRLSSTN